MKGVLLKIATCILVSSSLLSSCELFGGGGSDKKGGEVVWRLENERENTVGTQPLIQDQRVYFLQDGQLKAYTLEEGSYLWSRRITQEGDGDYTHKIIHSGDKLFIDHGFRIQAFNKTGGALVWETDITEDAKEVSGIGSPIMSQDEDYLYAGRKGYVLQLRKSDGQIVQRYPLDRLVPNGVTQGSTEPIISPFGDNILYVPTQYYDRTTPGEEEFGANIFAFDARTGEIRWETRVEYKIENHYSEEPGDSLVVSPPIYDIEVTESSIVALQGKSVIVLNRSNGDVRWFKNFPNSGFDVGLDVQKGNIYAASVGNFAYRFDLQTGEVIWQRDITYANTSIPTVQNGRMYFTNSGGGSIWVLDIKDGATIYHERPPNYNKDSFDVYISSLGVGEGYMVNVGSKAVYCLRVP
ncbi:PQQ-binding-like beta-propeller repeat protein [Fodinibius halophilus]|uniref:PQQ-binding-like beta-propeller repeat protein n=1 Tax=Fodinibius halophilus TaxID=1736908 RepID=A0A6M1T4P7_9BACT|nr:PQQ-binding-like beta-propeller repeat protein [Fodinibius halophilus]NGP89017.1 PQQ-binding-like beta-propeller repeat protein [Fodinibius halophilus]